MGEAARVDSIDVLKEFKTAIWKFQEAASASLGDAEAETHRVLMWLQTEQDSYWQHQIRKREELVTRCKEAVRMKKIFKDSSGRQQSAIDWYLSSDSDETIHSPPRNHLEKRP